MEEQFGRRSAEVHGMLRHGLIVARIAKFLFKLGLRRYPPMAELVGLAASSEKAVRTAALKYLLDNYMTRYADYDPDAFSNVAFIPAFQGDTGCLARPHEVNLSLSSYV